MSVRVLLADDHAIVRQGIRAVLEQEGFEIVGEAADGAEAVRLAKHLNPEVAVLDITMPLTSGIEATREIAKHSPHTKVILLTMHGDDHFVIEGMRAGASGYLMKSNATIDVSHAIRAVLKGEHVLSKGIPSRLLSKDASAGDGADPLSPRELEVLRLVAEGRTTKEVAATLSISIKTADSHRSNIMNKLNLHDTASIVRYAVRRGLVSVND